MENEYSDIAEETNIENADDGADTSNAEIDKTSELETNLGKTNLYTNTCKNIFIARLN